MNEAFLECIQLARRDEMIVSPSERQNVEQRRRLAETPYLMPHAIEEFFRVFTPVHALGRTAMRDVVLAGQSLKRGDRVILSWASANLDETEFETPEEVNFDRTNKRHLAFGLGSHRCMAPDVVRLEFQTLFERILARLPDVRVEEARLQAAAAPGVVAGYEHVHFVFTPEKRSAVPASSTIPNGPWAADNADGNQTGA